jgi:uncharacterized protein YkwD
MFASSAFSVLSAPLLRARRALIALAVAFALLCGSLVSSPKASADTVPSVSTAATIAYKLLDMLNAERASAGRAPLRMNFHLEWSAYGHNLRMASYDLMSHLLPGELSLGGRIMRAGYLPWRMVGENIAWNSDWSLNGAYYLENMMFNEVWPNDGHRQNILNPGYSDVGINVHMDALHHKMWITEDFGHLA